jgi:N-acetylmuramoyl-L-alanine amidase
VAGSAYDEHVELAVRNFQQQRGLTVDGVVGSSTYRRLDEARWTLGDRVLNHRPGNSWLATTCSHCSSGCSTWAFKVGRVDGYFGPATEEALRDFQRNSGCPPTAPAARPRSRRSAVSSRA